MITDLKCYFCDSLLTFTPIRGNPKIDCFYCDSCPKIRSSDIVTLVTPYVIHLKENVLVAAFVGFADIDLRLDIFWDLRFSLIIKWSNYKNIVQINRCMDFYSLPPDELKEKIKTLVLFS